MNDRQKTSDEWTEMVSKKKVMTNARELAKDLYVKLFIDGTEEDHQTVLLKALAQVEAETYEKARERDLTDDIELSTLAEQFPELNMNNYNESEVERLNDWGIQMMQLLERQQDQRAKEG